MSSQRFYDSLQKELLAKRSALKEIFTHTKTTGLYYEQIMRDFLRPRVKGCRVGHGQVVLHSGDNSTQLDIIIFDERIASPLFHSGDLVVLPSESVIAIVEVKSVFAIRSSWRNEIAKVKKAFEGWSVDEMPHVFYFCFISDKYTAAEHRDWEKELLEGGDSILDGFFALQTRDGFNNGELQRFVEAISRSVSAHAKPSRSLRV